MMALTPAPSLTFGGLVLRGPERGDLESADGLAPRHGVLLCVVGGLRR